MWHIDQPPGPLGQKLLEMVRALDGSGGDRISARRLTELRISGSSAMATVEGKPTRLLSSRSPLAFLLPITCHPLRRFLMLAPAYAASHRVESALSKLERVTRMMEVCGIKAGEELRREAPTNPSIGW